MRRRIRKFADRQRTDNQANKEQFKNWGHSNPLWIVGGAGQYQYLGTQLYSFSDFSNFFVIKVKDKIQRYTQGWWWSLGCPSSQDTTQDARPGRPDIVLVMAALYWVLGPISSVFFTDSLYGWATGTSRGCSSGWSQPPITSVRGGGHKCGYSERVRGGSSAITAKSPHYTSAKTAAVNTSCHRSVPPREREAGRRKPVPKCKQGR